MDTENRTPSGTELPEDFFSKDERTDEEQFMSRFESPVPFDQQVSFSESQKKEYADPDKDVEGTDDNLEDFKFDASLAEEEQKELDEFNAKFNTNFAKYDDLKQALKSQDRKEERPQVEQDVMYVNYVADLLNPSLTSERKLLESYEILEAIDEGVDIASASFKERLQDELDAHESNETLGAFAKMARRALAKKIEEKKIIINSFEQKKQLSEQEKTDLYNNKLQQSINDIYKNGKFLAIQPTKDDLLDIYKSVRKQEHIEHMKNNPADAVEFALFKKYKGVISKILERPGYNDGIKKALEEIGMSSSKSPQPTVDNSPNRKTDYSDYLKDFVK